MDHCCSNVKTIFVLCLPSVTCRNLPCTVLKVFARSKLNRAVFPNFLVRGSPRHRWEDIRMDLK